MPYRTFGTALAVTALVAGLGCTRGGGGIAHDPISPTSSHAAAVTNKEPAALDENDHQQPVYNAQKGFEDQLPPPDQDANRATNSDLGKPRWRNSLGTFIDDPSRYPGIDRPVAQPSTPAAEPGSHEQE